MNKRIGRSMGMAAGLLGWVLGAAGQEPVAEPKVTAPVAKAGPEAIAAEEMPLRDPFWPVGFYPEGWGVQEEELQQEEVVQQIQEQGALWNAAAKQLEIGGVSRRGDNAYIAIISGKIRKPGDFVTAEHEGILYRWKVTTIHPDGTIRFERVSSGRPGVGGANGEAEELGPGRAVQPGIPVPPVLKPPFNLK